MSVKGLTFKEIAAHLKQAVPELKWFDKDKGQFENLNEHVMPLPAVLISFGRTTYETQSGQNQKGNLNLRFRIGFENYADSFDGSINQDKALEFFDFNEEIYVALQGLSTTHISNLQRIADEDDTDHKNVIVTIMEFAGYLQDDSGVETNNFQLVEPNLNVEHKKPLSRPIEDGEKPFMILD